MPKREPETVSLPAPPAVAGDDAMRLRSGRVMDRSPDEYIVDFEPAGRRACWRASGCLLEPMPGDLVLVADSERHAFILSVLLKAEKSTATVSVPDVETLTLAQPRLALDTGQIAAKAERADLDIGVTRLAGKVAALVVERIESVARLMSTVAETALSRSRNSVRTVDGIDTLTAEDVSHTARKTMTMRSAVTVIESAGDVRIDGKRIGLG